MGCVNVTNEAGMSGLALARSAPDRDWLFQMMFETKELKVVSIGCKCKSKALINYYHGSKNVRD